MEQNPNQNNEICVDDSIAVARFLIPNKDN